MSGGWLALDAWLGGGDVPVHSAHEGAVADDRYLSFRAAGAVVEMTSELSTGAVRLMAAGERYAAAALTRQTVECEYLLRVFIADFAMAARWGRADRDEIRTSFMPSQNRKVAGFDGQEYQDHCSMGGHPTPEGWKLLRYVVAPAEGVARRDAAAWADLSLHQYRVWTAVDELLNREHARYAVARAAARDRASTAMADWVAVDPVADVFLPRRAGGG